MVTGVEVCHGRSCGGEKLVQLCELIGREEGEAGTDEIGDQDEGVEDRDAANGLWADTGGHVDSGWMNDVNQLGECVEYMYFHPAASIRFENEVKDLEQRDYLVRPILIKEHRPLSPKALSIGPESAISSFARSRLY